MIMSDWEIEDKSTSLSGGSLLGLAFCLGPNDRYTVKNKDTGERKHFELPWNASEHDVTQMIATGSFEEND